MQTETRHNPNEAPVGFYAVRKVSLRQEDGNLCRQCEWRPQCNDPKTDPLAYGHRCMSYPVVAIRDGKTYQREDKSSVAFKRRQ